MRIVKDKQSNKGFGNTTKKNKKELLREPQ